MRDSFEEVTPEISIEADRLVILQQEVIKVQESKKQLADVLLSPHDGGSAGDNLATLQVSTVSSLCDKI
jgi:hypothetical protein